MDYRDILGFSKKQPKKTVEKEVAPKPTTPPVTELLKEEFGPLNEWSEVDTGPKRWSKPFNSNMTEFEKEQMNEGSAYEANKVFSKAEKAYIQFQRSLDELGRFATKDTGSKTEQKIFESQWKKQVVPFYELMKSWLKRHNR